MWRFGCRAGVPSRARDLRDPDHRRAPAHGFGRVIVDVEISVNIAYGYDIRGEISCEDRCCGSPKPTGDGDLGTATESVRRYRPISGIGSSMAYDQEFREWIRRREQRKRRRDPLPGMATLRRWFADAALRAVESGVCEPVRMIGKPGLYDKENGSLTAAD